MKHHTEPLTPAEDAELERPSQSHSTRFGWDQKIRARGYEIKIRPNHGEPVWEKDGIEYSHSNVLLREGLSDDGHDNTQLQRKNYGL